MRAALILAFSASLALASPAFAAGVDPAEATPVQREQSQARFLRGRQLFDAKSFEPALAEFRASHDIVASPNSRLYIARTLRELGRNVEAYVELGRTEVEARELTRVDNRYQRAAEAAGEERAQLRALLGFVAVKITGADESTRLLVGGEEIRRSGWSEPIPVKPGTTEVKLETVGREPIAKSVTLEAGRSTTLDLDVTSAPAAPIAAAATAPQQPTAAPSPAQDAPQGTTTLRPYAIAAGGVAVVGLATFAIFGLMAKGTHDDLEARCKGGVCPSDPADDASAGKTQQTIANVGLVVGALGLAGAGVLFFAEPKPARAAFVRPTIGFGRVGVEGAF